MPEEAFHYPVLHDARTHTNTHVHAHARTHARTHAHTHTHTHTHTHSDAPDEHIRHSVTYYEHTTRK